MPGVRIRETKYQGQGGHVTCRVRKVRSEGQAGHK
jgi:hypothetical protein